MKAAACAISAKGIFYNYTPMKAAYRPIRLSATIKRVLGILLAVLVPFAMLLMVYIVTPR